MASQQDPGAAALVGVEHGVGQHSVVTARPSSRSAASTTRHLGAERPSAGGDLEPDETAADDDDLSRGAEPRRQPVGVGEGAHRVDPVEVGALDPAAPG